MIVEYEIMFPTIVPPTMAVVPTDHQTFDDRAPLVKTTDERWPETRIVTAWKIQAKCPCKLLKSKPARIWRKMTSCALMMCMAAFPVSVQKAVS